MNAFKIQLANMSRQELDDLRTLLLITLGQQHSTRRLMFEYEVEGDDSDPRLDLQEEKHKGLSPRSLTRSRFEFREAKEDLMRRLACTRDTRITRLPSLKDLEGRDCSKMHATSMIGR
ncbi:hypothetical protein MHU86_7988 [Fragilaria crotonensis]|nr:hypothetical protein MHU86_7988 [Fragilaria crotonensis]